jgi:hypothetical protein
MNAARRVTRPDMRGQFAIYGTYRSPSIAGMRLIGATAAEGASMRSNGPSPTRVLDG